MNYPDPLLRQITAILNDPSTTDKVKRVLLRDHLKLSERLVEELVPKAPTVTIPAWHKQGWGHTGDCAPDCTCDRAKGMKVTFDDSQEDKS